MGTKRRIDIGRLLERGTEIDRAVSRAARKARDDHRRAGLPMPVWRDGEVAWVPADEPDDRSRNPDLKGEED